MPPLTYHHMLGQSEPQTWTGVNERATDQSWSGLQMSTLLLGSGEAHLHNRTQIAW